MENENSSLKETTISITLSDKERLDRLKVHRREPYRDVLKRILDKMEDQRGVSYSDEWRTSPRYIKAVIDSKIQGPK